MNNNIVKLRKLEKSDATKLAILANNKSISDNLRDAFPQPYDLSDAEIFINNCLKQDPTTTFAIEYNGEYVGNIGLHYGEDIYRKTAEIGYLIGEPYWNKGIATKAINLITTYGFETLNIVRIYAGVFAFNLASKRVLEKCGYTHENTAKAAVYKNNKVWDEYRFSKIHPKYN